MLRGETAPAPPRPTAIVTVTLLSSRMRLMACVALLAGITAIAPGSALAVSSATKNCAKDVVDDWYGNARVDKLFAAQCYREAIRTLPVDVLDYSNAKEDILRALAYARKGQNDPGDGAPDPPTGTGTGTGTTSIETPPTGTEPDDSTETNAGPVDDDVDTAGPASVPIPLLVLGGLALLLLAAGGAGYLNRRRNAGGRPDSTA